MKERGTHTLYSTSFLTFWQIYAKIRLLMNEISPAVPPRSGVIPGAIILGLALVIGLGSLAWQKYDESRLVNQALTVSGRAVKVITADTLKWSLTLNRYGSSTSTEKSLNRDLDGDVEFMKQELATAGAKDITVSRQPSRFYGGYCPDQGYYNEVTRMSAPIEPMPITLPMPPTPPSCGGGSVTQTMVFEMKEAEKGNTLSGSLPEHLRTRGVNVNENRMEFSVSDDEPLRQELLGKAMENAREKAESIAPKRVGKVIRTMEDQLYFTPTGSTNSYGYGDETSSLQKKATLSLSVTFTLK